MQRLTVWKVSSLACTRKYFQRLIVWSTRQFLSHTHDRFNFAGGHSWLPEPGQLWSAEWSNAIQSGWDWCGGIQWEFSWPVGVSGWQLTIFCGSITGMDGTQSLLRVSSIRRSFTSDGIKRNSVMLQFGIRDSLKRTGTYFVGWSGLTSRFIRILGKFH